MRWRAGLLGFLRRYTLFTVCVVGVGQAWSWMFGLEDEVRAWAAANRPLVATILVLSAILYAMYDWMGDEER